MASEGLWILNAKVHRFSNGETKAGVSCQQLIIAIQARA
jgi:hypothetical protein